MESDGRRVTAGELRNLALLYHVSVEWLLGEATAGDEDLKLAARKLGGLKKEDLETVMRVIDSFRRG